MEYIDRNNHQKRRSAHILAASPYMSEGWAHACSWVPHSLHTLNLYCLITKQKNILAPSDCFRHYFQRYPIMTIPNLICISRWAFSWFQPPCPLSQTPPHLSRFSLPRYTSYKKRKCGGHPCLALGVGKGVLCKQYFAYALCTKEVFTFPR